MDLDPPPTHPATHHSVGYLHMACQCLWAHCAPALAPHAAGAEGAGWCWLAASCAQRCLGQPGLHLQAYISNKSRFALLFLDAMDGVEQFKSNGYLLHMIYRSYDVLTQSESVVGGQSLRLIVRG